MEFYRQTTEYTCAASSLLMVLKHYNPKFDLSRENEFKIWGASVNLPTRALSIYGMATFAAKQGVKVRLVLEETEYDYPDYRFKGYTKKEIDEAKFMSKIHSKNARDLGIPIEERDITVNEVKDLLKKGHVLMLRVNAGIFRDTGSTSKYLVFHKGTTSKNIIVLDPKKGVLEIEDEDLEQALETLHTKKKRDHRMMVFG